MQHRILSKVSSGFPHMFFVRQPELPVLTLIHIVLHVSCVMTEFFKLNFACFDFLSKQTILANVG